MQFALDYAFFLRKINRPQQALAEVLGMGQQQQRAFVPVIATAVRDPHLRPRATAVALLSMIDDAAVIAAIKPAAGERKSGTACVKKLGNRWFLLTGRRFDTPARSCSHPLHRLRLCWCCPSAGQRSPLR